MATSGSYDLTATRDDIITEALEQLGVLSEGDSPSAAQLTSCARTLNYMAKAWAAKGMNLWRIQDVYLFLLDNQHEYTLSASGDHWTTAYATTEVKTAQTSGNNTLELDAVSGLSGDGQTTISNGDYIGIETDSGFQWTTVNGAPSGTTVTLTANLADDVSVDATVYAYTTKNGVALQVLGADLQLNPIAGTSEQSIQLVSKTEFDDLTTKLTTGSPNIVAFVPGTTSGTLHVWPRQSAPEKNFLELHIQRRVQDFDAATDDADFPAEWYEALAFGLAKRLIPKYGIPASTAAYIKEMAAEALEDVESFDREEYAGFYIQPDK